MGRGSLGKPRPPGACDPRRGFNEFSKPIQSSSQCTHGAIELAARLGGGQGKESVAVPCRSRVVSREGYPRSTLPQGHLSLEPKWLR
eukprot:5204548-Alexandrium_andersonii.AAC.1